MCVCVHVQLQEQGTYLRVSVVGGGYVRAFKRSLYTRNTTYTSLSMYGCSVPYAVNAYTPAVTSLLSNPLLSLHPSLLSWCVAAHSQPFMALLQHCVDHSGPIPSLTPKCQRELLASLVMATAGKTDSEVYVMVSARWQCQAGNMAMVFTSKNFTNLLHS